MMAKEEQKKAKTKRPTALKRDIQNEKHRLVNKSFKARVRTAVRAFEVALDAKNQEQITSSLNTVYSLMDKGVKRGVFSVNKASRVKSRFSDRLSRV